MLKQRLTLNQHCFNVVCLVGSILNGETGNVNSSKSFLELYNQHDVRGNNPFWIKGFLFWTI